MTYGYIRFSTSKQEETQQVQAIKEWTEPRGITLDVIEKDEGVSGGVSYRDRKLYRLVRKLRQGDVLVCSEISRLGRSMSDLNLLINEELKPRKVRLIVTKMNLDLDCANMKAIDQMIFFALSFSAEIEKELIQSRTKSALDARKEAIEKEGGFMSKNGNWTKKLGAKKGHKYGPIAGAAAGAKHSHDAKNWRENSKLYGFVERCVYQRMPRKEILAEAHRRYEEEPDAYCTRQGKPLSEGTLSIWVREIELR